MTVRSDEFGVRRSENRRGGRLRPSIRGVHRGTPLHYSELFLKDRGFTLIEIIILIVMAGILLPAIIVPFVATVKGSRKPEMVNTAMYLAQYEMEEFMKYDYSDPTLNPTPLPPSYTDIAGFSGYQWRWSIYYLDSGFLNPDLVTDRGFKRIFVSVKDPENDTYEVCSVITNFP